MAIHFYMDVRVPMAVTDGLRRPGIDVLTSQGDGSTEHDDLRLLRRASHLRRVLFTQDSDFIEIASGLMESNEQFVGLINQEPTAPVEGSCV